MKDEPITYIAVGSKISIRSPRIKDAEALGSLLGTDIALRERGIGVSARNTISGQEFLETMREWCEKTHSISLAIVTAEDVAIGLISLSHIKAEERIGRIGYWIGSAYWGRGYTTEAFGLVLNLAIKKNLHQVSATVARDNVASWRIWKKFGGKIEEKDAKNVTCTINLTPSLNRE